MSSDRSHPPAHHRPPWHLRIIGPQPNNEDGPYGTTTLVLDYNGTLSCDGQVLEGVKERLDVLSRSIDIHVLTGDTFGRVRSQMENVPCTVSILPEGSQDTGKLEYVRRLASEYAVCMGNGRIVKKSLIPVFKPVRGIKMGRTTTASGAKGQDILDMGSP